MKMGNPEAAREQLRTALEVPPSDPFAAENKLKARTQLVQLD